jgi:Tfp pilus assembly protein PilO
MSNNWKKIGIYSAIYLIIFVITIFVFLVPATNNLKKTKTEFSEKQSKLLENQNNITYLNKLKDDPANFDQLYNNTVNYWPDNSDVSKFLIQTEGLAKDLGIVIQTVSINDKIMDKNNKPLPQNSFTLSFNASYPTTLQFIKKLENLARFNSENSIQLTLGDQDTLSTQLTGYIYYGK